MSKNRSIDEKLAGTKEIVTIGGKEFSPKRLTVFQSQQIINEAREKAKRIAGLQAKALRLGRIANSVNFNEIDLSDDKQANMLQEVLEMKAEFDYETSDLGYNWNLLKRVYDLTDEDLETISEDEYEAAIEAIFDVNPSLKKMKEMILMKPLTLTSQNT